MKNKLLIFIAFFLMSIATGLIGCKQIKEEFPDAKCTIAKSLEQILKEQRNIVHVDSSFLYFSLETNEQSRIGRVGKFIVHESRVYILDSTTKSLLCFNLNGKHIYTINKVGKGPGEYLGIYDFAVNKEGIFIIDNLGRKLLKYKVSGEYVRERKIKEGALRYIYTYKNQIYTYVLSTLKESKDLSLNSIVIYNLNLEKQYSVVLPKVSKLSRSTNAKNSFFTFNDSLFFCKGCDPILYLIQNKKAIPYLHFSFVNIPKEVKTYSELKSLSGITYFNGDAYAANDSMLFIKCWKDGKNYELVYDFFKNEIFANSMAVAGSYNRKITDPMMVLTLGNLRSNYNNKLYTLCEVSDVKNKIAMLSSIDLPANHQKTFFIIKGIMDTLNIMDNPIVFCNTYSKK